MTATTRTATTPSRDAPGSGKVGTPDHEASSPHTNRRPRHAARVAGRWWERLMGRSALAREAGMATAEYAIVTVAAAGFAGLLILILRSDEVRELLLGIIRGALSV